MSSTRKRKPDKIQTGKDAPNTQNTAKDQVKKPVVSFGKLLTRFCITIAVLGVVYYSSIMKNEITQVVFAKQDERLDRRSHRVECSSDYDEEKEFSDCLPKICGRVVTDTLISEDEALSLLKIAKKGFSYGGSDGGASILDLHSGALSKGTDFINLYKFADHRNIITDSDYKVYRDVKDKILQTIAMEFGSFPNKLYLTHPTFFSKLNSKPAKTEHDEYWHKHVDKETYESFHYTSLVYLTDYGKDFWGGEFVFVDKKYNMTIQPKLGRLSIFTSGSENPHYVEKVTSGERYALTVSFTCNKSLAITDIGPNPKIVRHSK